jgi:hypothetical protein
MDDSSQPQPGYNTPSHVHNAASMGQAQPKGTASGSDGGQQRQQMPYSATSQHLTINAMAQSASGDLYSGG